MRIIRAGWPDATVADVEFIMWNRTPFPISMPSAKEVYRSASSWFRAQKNSRDICMLCDGIAVPGQSECPKCDMKINGGVNAPQYSYQKVNKMLPTVKSAVVQSQLALAQQQTFAKQAVTSYQQTAYPNGILSSYMNTPSSWLSTPTVHYYPTADALPPNVYIVERPATTITKNFSGSIALPDGAKIVFENGNYRVEDKDAKITYRASNIRDFNRFLNASDLLQAFIRDLGKLGARQSDVLAVPIELFINWLILRSAEQDKTPPGALLHPRCRWCGHFIARARAAAGVLFCGEPHAVSFMRREALA